MLRYQTTGFSGYGVQYSPYYDNILAVNTGSNFGLVGNGKLFILEIDNNGVVKEKNSFLTKDCLFDSAWNELKPNQVVVAQGDGSLRLFDTTLQKFPIAIFHEHSKEVYSCNWNLVSKSNFVSSSWDGQVKIWSPNRKASLITFSPHPIDVSRALDNLPEVSQRDKLSPNQVAQNRNCIYQATFSPHDDNLILCCAGNSYVTLFDLRQNPGNNQKNFIAHRGKGALSCDFNKYRPNIIATSGVDNSIGIWDIRMLPNSSNQQGFQTGTLVNEIVNAHDLAVKKVCWSPHHSDILLSTSYDMSCKIWKDVSVQNNVPTGKTNGSLLSNGLLSNFKHHTEFVFGADWSLWGIPGYVATAGWDSNVFIWNGLQ
ncbi:PEX7 [Nakaseomyces glabratus]|nr:Trp-Asp (WD) repeats profile [Nakaseomyces glabratus]KAJ9570867.1 peroxisomal targeting signal 2 receptor [Nakaseomyces glabratus]KTB16319.1 Peroxisomal targeting signal 2 receptor [Nakaseomyces glabratus]KTB26737.1 Peroxisomal targeting signal 2 receptor [Nakaseomyces glabratus]OXB45113.1 hypothetical protein B1J91_B01529g [Nakaseomyces glabratus]